jgi:lipocalin
MFEYIFNDLNSIYEKKVNQDIVEDYKKFVGEKELDLLLTKFNKRRFTLEKKWNQVMGSRTTEILGSGFGSSSITAEYKKIDKDNIIVLNRAIDDSFQNIFVKGMSKPRDISIPTCRTVSFDNIIGLEGDYWIIHINDRLDIFIVVAPLHIPQTSVKVVPVFACYVLTSKTHAKFWSDEKNVQEILEVAKKYGFDNNILTKPVASAETLEEGIWK